jgi:hypothetical protein
MNFDDAVKEMRSVAPGRVTVVTYEGLRFALACGLGVWDYAESYALQAVIRDHGTPKQKQRLREELIARRWSEEIALAEQKEQ